MAKTTTLDPGPLQVERLEGGRRRLLRPLRVRVTVRGATKKIEVREGTETDYSSLPFGTRWIMNWDRVDMAGVVHDYLYSRQDYTRMEDDLIWWCVARGGTHRANCLQAFLGFAALVLFGWLFKKSYPTGAKLCFAVPEAILALGLIWWAVPSILACLRSFICHGCP